jgi:hypothetical protein
VRKFEILNIELSPGGPGPDRAWKITYKAIRDKLWVENHLWIIARTEKEAKSKAESRFGDK